jgi:hypothetical protein
VAADEKEMKFRCEKGYVVRVFAILPVVLCTVLGTLSGSPYLFDSRVLLCQN